MTTRIARGAQHRDIFEECRGIPASWAAQQLGIRTMGGGSLRLCRCPFHPDTNASLTLYPGERGYYCFGCGEGGDAVRLWARVKGLGMLAAAQEAYAAYRGQPWK